MNLKCLIQGEVAKVVDRVTKVTEQRGHCTRQRKKTSMAAVSVFLISQKIKKTHESGGG